MVGTRAAHGSLDVRRRRLLFRCWHRGTREMDLLMGRFADARIVDLSEAELDDCERLLEVADGDLFAWVVGTAETPSNFDTGLLRKLRAFYAGSGPVRV